MTLDQILIRAIDSVPSHAIFAFDSNGTVMSWNEGVRQVLGFGREDFLGSDADALFTPEDRNEGAPQWEREQAREKGTIDDFRWHLRKDGSRFWANGVLQAVNDDQGNPVAYVKIARDATRERLSYEALQETREALERRVEERTRELMGASEQLRRSESRFSEVFRVAPIAIALTTSEDRILDVNEAFERLSGYTREEALERNSKELGLWSSPEDRQRLREVQEGDLGFRTVELQVRTKDGQRRDILSSAAAVDLGERPGLVKMFLDVTDRKRTERQLVAALQEVMQDASWLAHRVMEKLAQSRGEGAAGSQLSELTERERQVLDCIAQGKSNARIGQELRLAPSTVRNYVTTIYSKIQVETRAEAVVWARDRGLGGP